MLFNPNYISGLVPADGSFFVSLAPQGYLPLALGQGYAAIGVGPGLSQGYF